MRLAAIVLTAALLFVAGVGVGLLISGGSNKLKADTAAPVAEQTTEEHALVVRVIDGDTVVLDNGEHVRYLGMDTPEVGPQDCFAAEATDRNRQLVEGKRVTLVRENEDRDRFGRLLRWIFLDDGTFVNAELVWEGYAHPFFFGESRMHQVFVQLELAASQARTGGWLACGWP